MSFIITREDILSVSADAAVICIENTMAVCEDPVSQRLGVSGGEALLARLKEKRFLSVGRAWPFDAGDLPFRYLFATGTPQWRYGECNELVVLRCCYESLFALAHRLACRSLALPFLSAAYYRFPVEDAVRIGLEEASKTDVKAIFLAQTQEEYELSQKPYVKPQILAYLGYYRDHAVFRLDNGLFAFVDLRPERREIFIRPYVRACYYTQADPFLPPLPEEEVARLRRIYEEICP